VNKYQLTVAVIFKNKLGAYIANLCCFGRNIWDQTSIRTVCIV